MAELATSALTAIFGFGKTVAGAATGAAAGGSKLLSVLQGVSTAIGVLGSLGAGRAAANADLDQAMAEELQAGQDRLKGAQRQTAMKRELARILGENEVAYAAAGIDVSAGIAQANAQTAKKRAASEISIDRADTEFQMALRRLRASNLRARAKSRTGGALIGALGQVANFGIDLAERD